MLYKKNMNEKAGQASQLKMGSFCAWIAGICYILIVICAFFSPTSVASYVASDQYFVDFESYQSYFIFLKCLMIIANGALVGVVASIYSLKEAKYEGILTLFTLLAIIGLGIGMFQSVLDATQVPHLAAQYDASPPAIQHVIIAFGVANPAIYALSLGVPGVWFIVISLAHLRQFPKFLVFLGIAWGVGNIITVIAHMLVLIWLIYLVAGGALIAAPFWMVWQSHYLRTKARELDTLK
ncbi:MAG: hypothetical protein S4CHLAM45_04160 [Chlamydiales bacterium]|nr:hypothetical protein [Chlamydiales bacterium]MCH9619270.1 hypothetical protein [Chlamydiales bacterium]MCH9622532.1 hypothetical protein [Chlamydiales bacterium]